MNKTVLPIALILLLIIGAAAGAADKLQLGGKGAADSFPPVDDVFKPQVFAVDAETIELGLQIVPGYYIYKQKLAVRSLDDDVEIGRWDLPDGTMKNDEYFGDMEVYLDGFLAELAVTRNARGPLELEIEFDYQGCAEDGLCYLPQTRVLKVSLPQADKKESTCQE